MNLKEAFLRSKNLGELSDKWVKHLQDEIDQKGVKNQVRFTAGESASLIASAALIANLILKSKMVIGSNKIRVLILGGDPIARMDRAIWASYAGEFLGVSGKIEIVQTRDENPQSSLYPVAEALGLKPAQVITHDEIAAGRFQPVDLAVWIHPAVEAGDYDIKTLQTAITLKDNRVPVYACVFNQLDLHIQNYVISERRQELRLFGNNLSRGSESVNCFGISSHGLGVEGGWGAVLCRLEGARNVVSKDSLHAVLAASAMMRAEGAVECSWVFGARINGVAFNKVTPVGLLGNMAVDDVKGFVLAEEAKPKVLSVVGHLWDEARLSRPDTTFELLGWAAKIKLAFNRSLPREPARRAEVIALLTDAYKNGLLEAGVGLARGYEALNTVKGRQQASELYREIADRHPLTAYALAYELFEQGDSAEGERLIAVAAEFGYPPAITDFGKLMYKAGSHEVGLAALNRAATLGDPEANFLLAEKSIEHGAYMEALGLLRLSWSLGHEGALQLALWLCTSMLEKNLGKRQAVKRELKDVQGFITKRSTFDQQIRAANA